MTDFEKLIWALGYIRYLKGRIKSLEFEMGMLKSELAEAKYKNGTERIAELLRVNKMLKDRFEHRRQAAGKRKGNQKKIIERLQKENDNLRLNQK